MDLCPICNRNRQLYELAKGDIITLHEGRDSKRLLILDGPFTNAKDATNSHELVMNEKSYVFSERDETGDLNYCVVIELPTSHDAVHPTTESEAGS